jgi:hypothetical protein
MKNTARFHLSFSRAAGDLVYIETYDVRTQQKKIGA